MLALQSVSRKVWGNCLALAIFSYYPDTISRYSIPSMPAAIEQKGKKSFHGELEKVYRIVGCWGQLQKEECRTASFSKVPISV